MNYTYELTKDTIIDDNKERTGYGISVRQGDKTLAVARDLSGDEEKISQLIKLFNDLGLSYIHFLDCIEDMLE